MHNHFDLVAYCSLTLNLFVPGTVFVFWERHININQTIPLLHCSLEHISVLFLSEMLSSFLLMKIWPSLPGPAWIPFFLPWSRSGKWEMTFFFSSELGLLGPLIYQLSLILWWNLFINTSCFLNSLKRRSKHSDSDSFQVLYPLLRI